MPALNRALSLSAALVVGHGLAHLALPTAWWQGPHVVSNMALAAAVALKDRAALAGGRPLTRQLAATAAAVLGAGMLSALAMRLPGLHRVYAEERVGSLPPGLRPLHLAVMVPLGTVVPEEVLFRGVLQQRWEEETGAMWGGILGSSMVFGLWHVGPSVAALMRLRPRKSPAEVLGAVAWTVTTTALAGIGFGMLRSLSGGLAAPIGAHLAINVVGSLAGRPPAAPES